MPQISFIISLSQTTKITSLAFFSRFKVNITHLLIDFRKLILIGIISKTFCSFLILSSMSEKQESTSEILNFIFCHQEKNYDKRFVAQNHLNFNKWKKIIFVLQLNSNLIILQSIAVPRVLLYLGIENDYSAKLCVSTFVPATSIDYFLRILKITGYQECCFFFKLIKPVFLLTAAFK